MSPLVINMTSHACVPPGTYTGSDFRLVCANDGIASTSTGSSVLSALYMLENDGSLTGQTTNNMISQIISYGYVTAMQQCKSALVAQQALRVNCDDNPLFSQTIAQSSSNCQKCLNYVQSFIDQRNLLDRTAHQLNPEYVVPAVSPALLQQMVGHLPNRHDGICKYVCQQCIAEDISQSLAVHITTECEVGNQLFLSAFTTGMASEAYNQLSKHKSALQSVFDVQSDQQLQDLSVQVSNTIRNITGQQNINLLFSWALALQSTSIDQGSTSVVVSNVDQSIDIKMMSSLVSSAYTDAKLQSAINFQENQKIIQLQQSFNDLVSRVRSQVYVIQDLLSSTMGKLMISLIAIVLLAIVGVLAFYYVEHSKPIETQKSSTPPPVRFIEV